MNYIRMPVAIYKLPLKGAYELSIFALVYNFKDQGLRMSNGDLATMLSTSRRVVERAIARLRKQGLIINKNTRKNARCLVVPTDIVSVELPTSEGVVTDSMSGQIPTSGVATTDMTSDHNIRKKEEEEEGKTFSSSAFVSYWNTKGNLPHIKAFTAQRQEKLRSRMSEPLFAGNWRVIIDKLAASSFATGGNQRSWKADIDWLLANSNNYAKVLEGKYDNRGHDNGAAAAGTKLFTPEQEQVFLDANTYSPTESEADELMKKMGLV
jgi:biotin operon repressor